MRHCSRFAKLLPKQKYGLAIWALCSLLYSCGEKKEQDDSGGVHVDDGKVYALATLPSGTQAPAAVPGREVNANFLRKEVHLGERYHICFDHTAFDDAGITAAQQMLKLHNDDPAKDGLEAVVNHALATVAKFSPGAKAASSRIEMDAIWPEGGGCDVLVAHVPATQFPFSDSDFSGTDRIYLKVNQLRTPDGAQNQIPVAYVAQSLGGADLTVGIEYVLANYLGLAESKLAGSYLNAKTTATTLGRGWHIENSDGTPCLDDDAQTLYGFALMYRNILKPTDLDTLHYYEDQYVGGGTLPQDSDLEMPAHAGGITTVATPGNSSLNSVRLISANINICVRNVSGVAISDANLAAYFSFVDPADATSVIGIMHGKDARVVTKATLVSDNCDLLVYLKNSQQYPFASNHINGMYAPEGSMTTKSGATSSLPVIYLNAANLDVDPAAQGNGAKPIKLVLQHEFAHFIGFKHSLSTKSLLSPDGYNSAWDLAGGDDKFYTAFLPIWSAHYGQK